MTCLRRRISSPRFQPLKARDSCLWDASLSEVSGARKSCSRWIRIDRPRVVRVLERIAADLDNLGLVPNDPQADKESNQNDPQARHRRELAEPYGSRRS